MQTISKQLISNKRLKKHTPLKLKSSKTPRRRSASKTKRSRDKSAAKSNVHRETQAIPNDSDMLK